ncbi:unnamed protein product [Closterium sp. NIES-54]
MASLRVLAFDHEGLPIQFDTWLDDLQLYLLSDSRDSVSLFHHTSGAAPAPPATADSATRSQLLTCDAAACLAIRNHLPLAECTHFGQHQTAHVLYDAVVTRYSSPATAALGRLLLPYLFPELSSFATVEDLVSHLRTSDARYRAALPAEFLAKSPPPMYVTLYFIQLLATETSIVAVGAARGTLRTPFFEGCSPSLLAPSYASDAATDVPGAEDVGAASAIAKRCSSKGKGGRPGVGGSGGGGEGSSGGGGGSGCGGSGGSGGSRTGAQCGELLRSGVAIIDLDHDAILTCMYALSVSAEGDCYLCVPPDPGMEAATLGASESVLPDTKPAEALRTFTLNSGASRCFFRDSTTLTPLSALVPVRLADPSAGPVLARSSTVLPCLARFRTDLPVLRLHCDTGGEFSSDFLRDFCRGEGILQSFTLSDSPQQNAIAERRIGLVMEVACTSMIHAAAAPHFLLPFAVWYAAHQLNLWPCVSLPETSPTLRWMGKVGDALPRPDPLSPQQLREWFSQRTRLWRGATGAGDSADGDTGAGGAGLTAGAGGTGGAAAAGSGGARTGGIGAAGTGGVGGAGAGDPTEPGVAGTGGARAVGAGAEGAGTGGTGARGAGIVDLGGGGTSAGGVGAGGAGGAGAVDPRA